MKKVALVALLLFAVSLGFSTPKALIGGSLFSFRLLIRLGPC